MELNKKIIHTSTIKPGMTMQLTLDDDFNVPDSKPDVEKLISSRGEIELTETECMMDKIRVSGMCHFYTLYATNMDSYPISAFDGQIPFEQTLNCNGICPSDTVKIKASLEDLNISIINSRKLSIRCLISLHATVCDSQSIDAAMEMDEESSFSTTEPNIQCLPETLNMTTLLINKKDIFRIKEELSIPAGKPPLYEILWSDTQLNNIEIKLNDSRLSLSGDLSIFLLYNSDLENTPVQFVQMELPFKGDLPCDDCNQDMIDCIDTKIATTQFAIKPDSNGEERLLDVECTLDLDIRLYEDEEYHLLSDIYSPNAECETITEPFTYARLLQKNSAKARITQRLNVKETKSSILQICHVSGGVKIDNVTRLSDGLKVEGVITADMLYLCGSDSYPVNSTFLMIPFNYLVELDGLKEQDTYEINAHLDQITVTMSGSDEVECKAIVTLTAIAFENKTASAIKEVNVSPLDAEKMQKMPGMIGYIVKPGDSLWNIAKTYYTTTARIKECNELENDAIEEGDKLIIVK